MNKLHLRSSSILGVFVTSMVAGCGGLGSAPSLPPTPQPTPIVSEQSPLPDGIWVEKGFGIALSVKNDQVDVFDYSQKSCLRSGDMSKSEFLERFLETPVSEDTSQLSFPTIGSFPTVYTARETLPSSCLDDRLITEINNPVATFNHFTQTMADFYPFFDLRSIDWDARISAARPQVRAHTQVADLRQIFERLLDGLDDGHVSLVYSEDDEDEYSPASGEGQIEAIITQGFTEQSETDELELYAEQQLERHRNRIASYFDAGSVKNAEDVAGTFGLTATIGEGRIGYIQIDRMFIFSENQEELVKLNLQLPQQLIADVMNRFRNTEGLIINVSENGGGFDAFGLAIANRFSLIDAVAFSSITNGVNDGVQSEETQRLEKKLTPTNEPAYYSPIAVISGADTASAAEVFLLAMRALPRPVCFVGTPSEGIFSDIQEKSLPFEGWTLNFGNQIFSDHTGQRFESIGVPVDIPAVPFALSNDGDTGNDAIDKALGALGAADLARSDVSGPVACSQEAARSRFALNAP